MRSATAEAGEYTLLQLLSAHGAYLSLRGQLLGVSLEGKACTEDYLCLGKTGHLLMGLPGRQVTLMGGRGMIYGGGEPGSPKC